MATTARAETKAARVTAAGATRTTAVMVATMMPNGDDDNKDSNSKNNNKATKKPTMKTEEGERCQSHRDNWGGGHRCPRDATIAPTAAVLRHTFVGSCCLQVERSVLSTIWEYIENLDKTWNKNLVQAPDLEQLAGQPFQILNGKSKSWLWKNLSWRNLASGMNFHRRKDLKCVLCGPLLLSVVVVVHCCCRLLSVVCTY